MNRLLFNFKNHFENNPFGVTVTYRLKEDGKIEVLNQGFKNKLDGEPSKAYGKSKIPDKSEPGKLKVSFFWIFYADYFVFIKCCWTKPGNGDIILRNYTWFHSRGYN